MPDRRSAARPRRWLPLLLVPAVLFFVALVLAPRSGPTFHKDPTHQTRRTSGAMQALDLWSTARAYPDKVIPDVGHAAAFEYSRSHLADGPVEQLTDDTWSPIGPHNIGGRTLAVVQNPQNRATLWAGAASGGLWRSVTTGVGANAWDLVDTGFPVLGVSSIAIAPEDSNRIFIGTGEVYGYQNAIGGMAVRLTRGSYGIGILRSTDGGATWTKSLDWSYNQRRGVASLAMHPEDPQTIYAGTTEGTYKTTDGGDSWNLVHPVLMSMHVVIDPAEPNRVYAACGDLGSLGTGIYRSTDSGSSWSQLTTGLPGTWTGKVWLAIYRSSPNVIYASIAQAETGIGLYYSVNYGDSWVRLTSTNYATYQGWYSHWVHVNPVDSTQVLVGGVDMWRSTQGGRNPSRVSFWSQWYFGAVPPGGPEGPPSYAHADHHGVTFDPEHPDTLYFATDGGVFRSFDGGQTFAGLNGGYQSTQFYNTFSSSPVAAELSIGGMQDNATAIYQGTVAWYRVIGGDGCCTAIHSQNQNIMYGSYQYLGLQRSSNGGVSFSQRTSGIGSDPSAFVAPFALCFSSPEIMYAGRSVIYKSTNGASNWFSTNSGQQLDTNPALSLAIADTDPDWVWVGTAPVNTWAGVHVTTNGGGNWLNITSTLPDRYPIDIAVHPTDPMIAYVVMSGFGSGHLFRTDSFGFPWVDLSGSLPDVPSSAIAIDPDHPHILYFGNDIGVYVSTDTGATWEEFQTGMPSAAIVMDLSVVRSTRKLRAATHGNGIFERALIDPQVAVRESAPAPSVGLELLENRPNPFTSATDIHFRLGNQVPVTLKIYDITGRVVATLLAGETREPGEHLVRLDARGLGLAPGVYLGRIEAGDQAATQRLVLTR